MKKSVLFCDKCNKQLPEGNNVAHKFNLFKERRSNGTESENWYWTADLCFNCLSWLVSTMMPLLEQSNDKQLKDKIITGLNCREE